MAYGLNLKDPASFFDIAVIVYPLNTFLSTGARTKSPIYVQRCSILMTTTLHNCREKNQNHLSNLL